MSSTGHRPVKLNPITDVPAALLAPLMSIYINGFTMKNLCRVVLVVPKIGSLSLSYLFYIAIARPEFGSTV